jgi:hypothetical protein
MWVSSVFGVNAKWLMMKLSKSSDQEYTANILNKKFARSINDLTDKLHASLRPQIAVVFGGSNRELKETLLLPSSTTLRSPGFDINVTTFGLGEVRLQVSGSYGLFGVPPEAITGDTMQDKVATLTTMTKVQFFNLCAGTSGAFSIWVRPHLLVAIPAGHLVVTCCGKDDVSETGITMIKWSVLSKEMLVQASATIGLLLQSHAYLGDTDYKIIYDLIKEASTDSAGGGLALAE